MNYWSESAEIILLLQKTFALSHNSDFILGPGGKKRELQMSFSERDGRNVVKSPKRGDAMQGVHGVLEQNKR